VIGRGLIVHAQPDDYKSQPVGNAGARLACAVIQKG
jgi:Cu-Zn family superoxide dismutase